MFALKKYGFDTLEEKQNGYALSILAYLKTNQLKYEKFQKIAADNDIACKKISSSNFNVRCDYDESAAYFTTVSHFVILLNYDNASGEIRDVRVALGASGL